MTSRARDRRRRWLSGAAGLALLSAGCNTLSGIADYATCPECPDDSAADTSSKDTSVSDDTSFSDITSTDGDTAPADTTLVDTGPVDTGPVDTGPPPADVTDATVDTSFDCSGKVDGTECAKTPRAICLKGACKPSQCGDLFVDGVLAEECEDGNKVNGDGCDNDCKYSCTALTAATKCDDKVACNGIETCNEIAHKCKPGTPVDADGDGYQAKPCGDDCDDTDFDTKPSATGWFTKANSKGSWDYDCSGAAERQYPFRKCSDYSSSTCPGAGFDSFDTDVACGDKGTRVLSCQWIGYCNPKYFDDLITQGCH